MSVILHGNLCNTTADVAIDSALLVLNVCAYIPQILRVLSVDTPRGLSTYFVLCNVLFSNAQLSQALLAAAWAWPSAHRPVLMDIVSGRLTGVPALGGIFGLLQIFAQWLCSVLVLVSLASKPQHTGLSGELALVIGFVHAAIVLFPVVELTLPKPTPDDDMGKGIYLALVSMSNSVVALCFVVLQCYAQFLELRARNGNPGAMSLLSLCVQMLTITALAFRWTLRLGSQTERNFSLWYLYQWAFPAANYAIYAFGCAFLLACYSLSGRGT